MKPRYEQPSIVRHVTGTMNKFGTRPSMRPVTEIDGVTIEELVAAYGSPLFVFSERRIRRRHRELRDELARHFADFQLLWSYKTNYLGAICRVFREEGSWAEVVSGFELQKALGDGVPGSQIVFNGPGKSADDLRLAFREGARVQIDHLDELALAERVARELQLRPKVGIRVSIAQLPVPSWDRFGFNLESGRAMEAARRIVRGGTLQLDTLHSHIGTFILDPEAYRLAARELARFGQVLAREHGIRIDTLDFGGGFASHNTLHAQYLPGEEVTPSFAQYVERLASGLEEGLEGAPAPRINLETGRALIDDAGFLVSTVLGNKRFNDGRRAVILDAGVNILPTAWWYRHEVHPAQEVQGLAEPTVFVGPLCMSIDVVRDRILFPPLHAGQRVVIAHVGAYNVTQWMQFITLRPNVVMVGPQGRHGLIRRAESLETILAQEVMPPWLGS